MSLRLGFDMDGVVADLNAALALEAMRLFPGVELRSGSEASVAPPAPDPDDAEVDPSELTPASLPLSRRQERQLWDEVTQIENFWETLDETEPGIIRRLADLARVRRWEMIFLTSRPRTAGDPVQVQSRARRGVRRRRQGTCGPDLARRPGRRARKRSTSWHRRRRVRRRLSRSPRRGR